VRRLGGLAAVAAVVPVALLLGSGPAYGADGRIVRVIAEDGKVQVVFEAPGLADADSLDPTTVRLQVADRVLPATGQLLGGATPAVQRVSLLVIDTSGSMRGEGLDAAKAAADEFLSSVPDDVRVGLVSFAGKATLRVPPTMNREAVRSGVEALTAGGGTALYDSLDIAVGRLMRSEYADAVRSIVLLSDGEDRDSDNQLSSVLGGLKDSGIGVDAVAFRTTDALAVLRQIVQAGSGRLVEADKAEALSAAFAQSAKAISSQVVVTAPLPPGTEPGQLPVTVAVTAEGGETYTDQAVMLLAAADVPPEQPRVEPAPTHTGGWASSERTLPIALALVFLGAVVVAGFAASAFATGRRESIMRQRLAPYTLKGSGLRPLPTPAPAPAEGGLARAAVGLAEKVVAHKDLESRLASRLEAAAIPMKPAEWLLLHTGVALGTALLLLLISVGDVPLALLGLLLGGIGPHIYLTVRQSRRKQKFEENLAPTLQLLAGSLAAGHSLPQAVDTVAHEAPEPIASELRRAVLEARLAVTVEDALEHVAERTGSEDFAWVAMAVRIQRNVGGNLAELLTTVAATLRERERLRRHVRVLSAEGRLSAVILGALPIVFTFYLFAVRRDYLMKLVTDPLGVALVIAGSALFVGGILWMIKVARVEV
jgi:tight adherence protein B